jgi:hypothetical protein
MNERLYHHYDPIRDHRLFPKNTARRKFVRWNEKINEEQFLKGY